jgi:hypothetical protein
MDSGDDCPDLLVRCHEIPCTLGEFADKAQAFMAELMPLHPGFAQLRFTGRKKADSPLLEPDLSNLRQGIFERSWDRQAPDDWRHDWGADCQPAAHSRHDLGFRLSLTNLTGWDEKIDVSAKLGSLTVNGCDATLPRKVYPEFRQQPLAGQLLEVFVRHWPTRYASYATRGWNWRFNFEHRKPEEQGNMEIGWLHYASDPSVAEALPQDAGITCKTLGKGIVFQIGDHLPDFDSPADVALATRVRQALAAAGKLKVR